MAEITKEASILKEVYVIMFIQRIFENVFYTDKNRIADRVEALNVLTDSNNYWYQTLIKK